MRFKSRREEKRKPNCLASFSSKFHWQFQLSQGKVRSLGWLADFARDSDAADGWPTSHWSLRSVFKLNWTLEVEKRAKEWKRRAGHSTNATLHWTVRWAVCLCEFTFTLFCCCCCCCSLSLLEKLLLFYFYFCTLFHCFCCHWKERRRKRNDESICFVFVFVDLLLLAATQMQTITHDDDADDMKTPRTATVQVEQLGQVKCPGSQQASEQASQQLSLD